MSSGSVGTTGGRLTPNDTACAAMSDLPVASTTEACNTTRPATGISNRYRRTFRAG